MMLKRTRAAGTTAALIGGALLLTGCGGQGASNSMSAPENLGADTARSDTAGNDSNPADGNSTGNSASNCSAQDFEITMQAQTHPRPGAFLLAMKNTSDKPCELGGWVDLTPTNAAGKPTDVPSQNVEVPGPSEHLTLEPGKTAFAGVQTERGDKADPNTHVVTGFTAKPSNMDGEVNAEVKSTDGEEKPMQLPITSLKVGTLQPTPQGVAIDL